MEINKNSQAWEMTLRNMDRKAKQKISAKGPTSLVPGDIVEFSYFMYHKDKIASVETKKYLIVSTRRGPTGNFISTKNNKLLCCFEINDSVSTLTMVLDNFYKNDARCSYVNYPATLFYVFGKDAFRTFIYQGIKGLFEIYVEKTNDTEKEEKNNKEQEEIKNITNDIDDVYGEY